MDRSCPLIDDELSIIVWNGQPRKKSKLTVFRDCRGVVRRDHRQARYCDKTNEPRSVSMGGKTDMERLRLTIAHVGNNVLQCLDQYLLVHRIC